MYKIVLNGIKNKHQYDELIKVFLRPEDYSLFCDLDFIDGVDKNENTNLEFNQVLEFSETEKNALKKDIYLKLSQLTGKSPEWGIHTGVRPVKLVGELFNKLGSMQRVEEKLKNFYLFNDDKISLICNTYHIQQQFLNSSEPNEVGLYIGIPFCPTRCLYCSFTSNQSEPAKIQEYMDALQKEIRHTGKRMKEIGMHPESIYIGGGTPTTLTAEQLDILLNEINNSYELNKCKEFTVEAGRPDTITLEKLKVLKKNGIERISINPQTMNDKTLELIGRAHSSNDILDAFDMARNVGIPIINTDIIAGLPEETIEDFENSINEMIKLNAENITVHTLAVKRGSKLIDVDSDFHYKQALIVKDMLALSKNKLYKNGYKPYYLYRQKHMAGSLENVGFTKNGCESIYNIRIMEEHQTIVALGAGGISKAYNQKENKLKRVPNVSNFEIYISRLNEMLQRKDDNLFRR